MYIVDFLVKKTYTIVSNPGSKNSAQSYLNDDSWKSRIAPGNVTVQEQDDEPIATPEHTRHAKTPKKFGHKISWITAFKNEQQDCEKSNADEVNKISTQRF